MKSHLLFGLLLLSILFSCEDDIDPVTPDPVDPDPEQGLYFPPNDNTTWETTDPNDLNWDTDKLDDLNTYLAEKNTKGFIILKDGKIVVEEYYNGHTLHMNNTWFSAAKSLISTLVGIAQRDGHLDIDDMTSVHLGDNWSSLDQDKQNLISVKNHLTMTTGLQNPIGNIIQWTCTAPLCMKYEVDAGTRWAYHQGAYTLTQDIISSSTGIDFQQYCRDEIQDKIGMNGSWTSVLDLRIFSSTTRSMARFGLLTLNKGTWIEEEIFPEDYYAEMINTSQEMNKAYGYLWWLNGKENFLTTQDQTLFPGKLIPNAPDDMFAALGAEDQKIYIVPSQDLVVIRCGDTAGNTEFASSSFDNELWGRLNEIIQ